VRAEDAPCNGRALGIATVPLAGGDRSPHDRYRSGAWECVPCRTPAASQIATRPYSASFLPHSSSCQALSGTQSSDRYPRCSSRLTELIAGCCSSAPASVAQRKPVSSSHIVAAASLNERWCGMAERASPGAALQLMSTGAGLSGAPLPNIPARVTHHGRASSARGAGSTSPRLPPLVQLPTD
jgi:hypothetical protein